MRSWFIEVRNLLQHVYENDGNLMHYPIVLRSCWVMH